MPPSSSAASRETRREVRFYSGILLAFVAVGVAVAVGFLVWRIAGARVVASWLAIPLEMRVTVQLSLIAGTLALAAIAGWRTWRDFHGRARARAAARDTPPILEFSAGSITAATLTSGELLPERTRAMLDSNRRKYLVRPRDALSRSKRQWGEPVVFEEPTRAGDTRIEPVLALAAMERRKHQKNINHLAAGVGQLSSVRVVVGVGKGYTSLTRAHALRGDLARIQGKIRMNVFVADPVDSADFTTTVPLDRMSEDAVDSGVLE